VDSRNSLERGRGGDQDSLQVCVAFPEVLKQSRAGEAQVGGQLDSAPRCQAADSILNSGYFYEEPSSFPTLAKSVSAQESFKLQPNLAPSSHTASFPKAHKGLAGTELR
jgi:hypothetical protein